MKTYPQAPLSRFFPDQKFIWNDKVYTVYQHCDNMTEVWGNGRFWAWPSCAVVTPVVIERVA